MYSVSDKNRLNPQDKSLFSSLVPLTSLLKPFTGPKDRVVHLGGLTEMAKGHELKLQVNIYTQANYYVTGFVKTNPNHTKLKPILLLNIKPLL